MSAAATRTIDTRRFRDLVTPEGVDLKLVLADASERASAFVLDLVFIVLSLIALTLVVIAAGLLIGFQSADLLSALWLLGFFFLRVFYFTAFEMTPRAATPGKRILRIRVSARDGGALSADAIFARNAMRELEFFLPLTFVVFEAHSASAWVTISAVLWCGVFVFFPLFNRDRLRIGDIVAGTWVVHAPRRVLDQDLSAQPARASLLFSREALDAYGIHELAVLEDVLRRDDLVTMYEVARRIRAKIGMSDDKTPDAQFLAAYYTALRGRLENRLLFGRRKRDKFDKG